jgi:hypothetical protein
MHTARDTGRTRALPTTADTSRRRLFAAAASALVAGAAIATAAHGQEVIEPDAEAPWLQYRPDRHPEDMRILRLMTIANGIEAPRRGRALAMVADEAMRLAALEPADPDNPDAELLRLCAEFHTQHAIANAPGPEDASEDAIDYRWELSDQITTVPAQTDAGRRAKASVAVTLIREARGDNPPCEGDTAFALAFLAEIAGGRTAA